jgi:hypothetical protein
MHFESFAGRCDARSLSWARLVYGRIFESMPLVWQRHGTWIEAWHERRRIAFAPHQKAASIYFQESGPVNRYREWGGCCETGKVCIRIPLGGDFEGPLLARIIAEHLGLPDRSI